MSAISFQELDLGSIGELLAGSRARGDYDSFLAEFLNANIPGVEVPLDSGTFAGKNDEKGAKNVVTGFNNARTRMNKETGKAVHEGGNNVQVILRAIGDGEAKEYHVFLINKALVGQTAPAAAATDED